MEVPVPEFFPESLVAEILRRLPLKNIGKCSLVCKSWNRMIKSEFFISSKLSLPLLLTTHHLPCSAQKYYSICSLVFEYHTFSIRFNDYPIFVAALNGIVCLSSRSGSDIILCNPSIRRQFQLPNSPLGLPRSKWKLGFGFDSKNNDFKVVRICRNLFLSKVELYSLNEGAWRVINASCRESLVPHLEQPLFFDGNVHWLALDATISQLKCRILMFDVSEEKFNWMECPELGRQWLSLNVIDGCLSLVDYSLFMRTSFDVWMRRESWTKTYSVSLDIECSQLLGLSTSAEVLVNGEISLHLFDLKSQKMRNLGDKIIAQTLCASGFTESLALLNKEDNTAVLVWGQG